MLDIGLFASGVVIWVVLMLAARWAPLHDHGARPVVDRLMMPALAVLLVGRLVAVLLEDRNSLRSIPALLVVRSGVEFWAGVVALIALLTWSGHGAAPCSGCTRLDLGSHSSCRPWVSAGRSDRWGGFADTDATSNTPVGPCSWVSACDSKENSMPRDPMSPKYTCSSIG